MNFNGSCSKMTLGITCDVQTMNYWAQEVKNIPGYRLYPKKQETDYKVCDRESK